MSVFIIIIIIIIINAKVSARQPWYIGHNSLNDPSLAFFTVTPSSAKFREYLNLQ